MKHSYKLETIDGELLIPVWKVINDLGESPIYSIYKWKSGWNTSNRIHKEQNDNDDSAPPGFRKSPCKNGILRGFHFFLAKKDATKYKTQDGEHIVKMYVRKNDIVAYGRSAYALEHDGKALVAMNAYWSGKL